MESKSELCNESINISENNMTIEANLKSTNMMSQKYLDLYNAIKRGYFKINESFSIIEVNKTGAALVNIDKNNLLNNSFDRYILPDYHNIFSDACQRAKNQNRMQLIKIMLFKQNGSIVPAKTYINSFFDPDSNSYYFLVMLKKIKGTKKNDLTLSKSLMSSSSYTNEAEHLLSIISHELNHPFGVIYNYLNGSLRRLESGNYSMSEIVDGIKIAANQLKRLSEIVLRMKNYNTKKSLCFDSVKINEFIVETVNLIQKEADESKIIIKCNIDKSYPEFKIDKIQMQQALLHIIRNSIEAMRDAKSTDPRINLEINLVKKNMLEITISDNGPGILPEHIDQLFNPYFTTKSYGVGLGLSISQNIVEAHGGKLYVEKNSMIGSCFVLNFVSQL